MHARALGDVARGGTFEAVMRKSLDRGIQQFLLRHDAALLLFSRRPLITCCRLIRHVGTPRILVFPDRLTVNGELVQKGQFFSGPGASSGYSIANIMRTPARFSTASPFSTTGSNSHFSTARVAESTNMSPGSDPTTWTSETLPSTVTVNTTSTHPEMLRLSADRG